MKIVILGGSGNIGTAVTRALASGHDVVSVARRLPPPDSDIAGLAQSVPLDIAHDRVEDVVAGADVVIVLAWLFQPTHRPAVTWRNNAVGTARALRAIASSNVGTVIAASSVAAYSPAVDADPVGEDYETHGTSSAAYCREKAYVERLLDGFEADQPGVRVCRLRPAFVFRRSTAEQQRRLFGGPLVPGSLLRPSLVPVLPVPQGLRLQAVHSDDVAAAVAACVDSEVQGAFNLAGDDVLGASELAELFAARPATVPAGLVRTALATAWHARLAPAPPALFDALMRLPVMSTERARSELGWSPANSAGAAVADFLEGLREGAGDVSPPLRPDDGVAERAEQLAHGVGQ
jgi:nucleoside-diphosphate-sugar epimerase